MNFKKNKDCDIIRNKYGVVLPKAEIETYIIDNDKFEFYYGFKGEFGGPYVTIEKRKNNKWFYTRLNNVRISEDFENIQECIDTAFYDMICSKH